MELCALAILKKTWYILHVFAGGDAQLFQDGLEPVTVSLEDVLLFATGADKVPPLGFDPPPLQSTSCT